MPLQVPVLDDLTYDGLVAEALSLIPRATPQWTDYNPSDPGITLLELFAFLFDALSYQQDRISERTRARFPELIGEAVATDPITGGPEDVDGALRRALGRLSAIRRAITEGDLEALALQAAAPQPIARARAVVDVQDVPELFPAEETLRVVVVPDLPSDPAPVPTHATRQAVFTFLEACRLLTARVQVVEPTYTDVDIEVHVVRDRRQPVDGPTLVSVVERSVTGFLSPLVGGPGGNGWEFGRPVYRSELYQLVEGIVGVDHIRSLLLGGDEFLQSLPLSGPTALPRARAITAAVEG